MNARPALRTSDRGGSLLLGKRRALRALLCTVAVLGATVTGAAGPTTAATTASSSKWAQNGADAAQSNRNTGETALTSATVNDLVPDYSLSRVAQFGECGGGPFRDDVPVSDGTSLYYFDGARVVAVDLATGARRWRTPLTFGLDSYVSSLAVAGGRLFVAGADKCDSSSNSNSFVAAYSTQNGARLWRTSPIDPKVDSMAVAGNHVVVTGWDGGGWGPTDSLDPLTGATQWSTDTTPPADRACKATSRVFVVGTVIPLVCHDDAHNTDYTTGVSLSNGAELWRKAAGYQYWRGDGPSATTPRNIYATDPAGHLVAMRQDGTTVWSSTTESGPVLAAGPSRIYVACDSDALCALDRRTGVRLWKAPGVSPTRVAIAADVVYPTPGSPLDAGTGAALTDPSNPYYLNSRGTAAAVAAGHLWIVDGRSLDVYSLR